MMKKLLFLSVALLFVSHQAFAQDSAPYYIPGMPVPQSNSAAPSADASAGASGHNNSGDGGRISKVSKVDPDKAGTPEPEPAPVQVDEGPVGYKGVTPPTRLVPENQKTFAKKPGNQLSWIGFMPEQGAHRVFIQTSQPTQYERLATSADRVEILIANTKLAVSNNQRELDMTYFQTPFAKAKAERSGTGVKVTVLLKEAATVDVQQHDNIIDITVRN